MTCRARPWARCSISCCDSLTSRRKETRHEARRRIMKIAVLGGGNGSFAAASDFALQGHDVRLWRRDTAEVAAHRAAGSRIVLKDVHGRHDVPLTLVTSDI